MKLSRVAAALAATACSLALAPVAAGHDDHRSKGDRQESLPLVIGHRGAPGHLPDHTLAGYAFAIRAGADYIEPDLVSTKDGYLVARHEPNISATTDVKDHPEFARRMRTVSIDGEDPPETGWFVSDFTLKELKTLRAVQPLAFRPKQFNGRFKIPTFDQILRLARRLGRERGRPVGVYPETKHPTYHRQLGLPLENKVVNTLRRFGLNHRNSPVFIQSFEQSNLKYLNQITPVKLVQLVDAWDVNPDGSLQYVAPSLRPYDWTVSGDPVLMNRTFGFFATNAGLDEIATYADVISPWKRYIVSTKAVDLNGDGTIGDENGDGAVNDADRALATPTSLVRRAHVRGLDVHTWTFRNEPRYLAADYGGDPYAEYAQFFGLGIDGVFSDYADSALAARDAYFSG